ncbi:fructosamine kinase family protein [Cutibacterium avidum]|uniref:fructosamine kinase family protein n=1 Tax=Cutibacterium avidum TaxID=33010 RepID=UPI00192C7BC4|nr:fructosamine kinase family protein [Cutibacterium avidum]QQY14561.1 fructosamine kinase family protein [Cutibacterium avidum]
MDEVVSAASYASTVRYMTFRKTDHHKNAIDYEVAGLRWLAAAQPAGAAIVEVLDHGNGWLTEPELSPIRPTREAAEEFGRRLAHTHAAGASHLGAAPDGFTPDGGYIGRAPLRLSSEHIDSWGEFYAHQRIEPYLDSLDADARAIISKLVDRLASGVFDHDQPALVTDPAARTHGDMWSGNLMWTSDGVVLIDPAAQGGHAEEDLASLSVFGAPFTNEIRAAYDEESPLADGWQERVGLHQLHMLIVHCFLFGGGYVGETVEVARRYL